MIALKGMSHFLSSALTIVTPFPASLGRMMT
jgi:hypothetical protein